MNPKGTVPMTDLQDHLTAEFDDLVPDEPEARERWSIGHDRVASWALRKIAGARAEQARLKEQADDEIDRVNRWLEQATGTLDSTVAFMEGKLAEYHNRLIDEGRADPAKPYKLPAGDLSFRKDPDTLEIVNRELLADTLESYDRIDLLRVKIEPKAVDVRQEIGRAVAVVAALGCYRHHVPPVIPGAYVNTGTRKHVAKPAGL